MNRHFEDARYYLKRAVEHATLGLRETLEPVERRVQEWTGREPEPEPSPVGALLEEARTLEERAEGEAREVIGDARERLDAYRPSE